MLEGILMYHIISTKLHERKFWMTGLDSYEPQITFCYSIIIDECFSCFFFSSLSFFFWVFIVTALPSKGNLDAPAEEFSQTNALGEWRVWASGSGRGQRNSDSGSSLHGRRKWGVGKGK